MENETAIEWFYKELKNLIKESELTDMKASEFETKESHLIEQAKEMEKDQIKEANLFGWREALDESVGSLDTDEYYNKTFKSE